MKISYLCKVRDLNKKLEFLYELFGDITMGEMIRKINT
jgi:hypothetical protein